MSESTGIEWTDATWNPWVGCSKVSPGCAHCYMFRDQYRFGQDPDVVRRSKTTFTNPLRWKDARRVFTCSWSDWFHDGADAWRDEAWDIIRRTPQHTYQILTKRPERIAEHLPPDWGMGYPNVWLGVSVETQRQVERIEQLARVSAAVRFVSFEPLLGPIDLILSPVEDDPSAWMDTLFGMWFDWAIIGGESGPDHRPMKLEWARGLVRQCRDAEVAVFVKQLGGWPDKQGDPDRWPEDLRVREFPGNPPAGVE